ncbi:hypothetical protein ACLQ2S_26725 [Micromonospora sp. DT48]|uniref:hypothetical protein n=1 Tax=unclassified Micromonospora TaxID=2617518 RepID=UPI0018AD136A|nr:hypothetical protein [Micromonospora sp. CP22]
MPAARASSNTGVSAELRVQGSSWVYDSGSYKYYAAIQRSARDRCAMYSGEVLYGTSWQSGGQSSWGNCG